MFTNIIAKFSTGEINLIQALEEAYQANSSGSNPHVLSCYVGKNVFIRTVTHHYTGNVAKVVDGFMELSNCAWIADDGNFSECLNKGSVNEVEPFNLKNNVFIGIGAIVDITKWEHPLPLVQK